jgi:AcrR family transcriptional regulator
MKSDDVQERVPPNRRQLQAAQTRRDIVMAATKLFTRQGYARTSVTDIAREAGVAVQTIYSSVGSKAQLVTAMLDEIDAISGIPEVSAQAMRSTDPGEVIDLSVRLTRQLNERCREILGGLRSAAQVDEAVAAAYAAGHERHRTGARRTVERVAALSALPSGVDVETALVTLSVLTWSDTWEQLVAGHGWSYDRAERWLASTLRTLLLAGAHPRSPKSGEPG